MGIPMLKIRRSRDRLIFNMGIPTLVRRHLYIETAPWFQWVTSSKPFHLDINVMICMYKCVARIESNHVYQASKEFIFLCLFFTSRPMQHMQCYIIMRFKEQKWKCIWVTIKVTCALYSCLLYSEIHIACNSSSMGILHISWYMQVAIQ